MKNLLLVTLLFPFIFFGQQTPEVEKIWLKKDVNLHTSEKSFMFFELDSLLNKDSSKIQFKILPDEIFNLNVYKNGTTGFTFQKGLAYTLTGNIKDKVSYIFDLRLGTSDQSIIPYTSIFQTKSFFFENIKVLNPFTAYSIYGDIRGRIQYKPNSILTFTTGIDRITFGEGDRSLFLGNQGVPAPFASLKAKFGKLEYSFIQQIWRERSGNHYSPKGNATHYLSFNPSKKWNFSIFETVVYQMKDTLYNRGFEVEYLNPLIFYRPQEYNMGSADNILLGLHFSYKHANAMFYGQVLIDDFLLSAFQKQNGWWSNKYGLQVGLKGWKTLQNSCQIFYRTEFNLVRPYTYSQKSPDVVLGNQGLPVAHPLGSNFIELYQEVSFHFKKWSYEFWGQGFLKGSDYFSSGNHASFGGDIYRPYNLHPYEYGNTIGQGKTRHVLQVGAYISRKIKYERILFELIKLPKLFQCDNVSFFIEPKARFSNVEDEVYSNFYLTVGTIKTLGRERRNY